MPPKMPPVVFPIEPLTVVSQLREEGVRIALLIVSSCPTLVIAGVIVAVIALPRVRSKLPVMDIASAWLRRISS